MKEHFLIEMFKAEGTAGTWPWCGRLPGVLGGWRESSRRWGSTGSSSQACGHCEDLTSATGLGAETWSDHSNESLLSAVLKAARSGTGPDQREQSGVCCHNPGKKRLWLGKKVVTGSWWEVVDPGCVLKEQPVGASRDFKIRVQFGTEWVWDACFQLNWDIK